MTAKQTNIILSVAEAIRPYRVQGDPQTNVDAVTALMKCAAAVMLGAVDHGWLPDVATARLAMVRAAEHAFDRIAAETRDA